MKKTLFAYISFLFALGTLFAQNGKTERLDTVTVETSYQILPRHIQKNLDIPEKTLETSENLTRVLERETPFQLREYGAGMVSGLSIRGASPSQISVIWNNIPVNSPLNGQTDLNTIGVYTVDRVRIFTGDAGFLYGSGAIGGAVLLENKPRFQKQTSVKLSLVAGDFGKWFPAAKFSSGNRRWNVSGGFAYWKEKNDFSVPQFNYRNLNAEILHHDFNLNLFHRFNNNLLAFNLLTSFTDRNLPGTIHSRSDSKLQNTHYRFAFNWKNNHASYRQLFTAGYLVENYTYYYIKEQNPSGYGRAAVLYLKENFDYRLNPHLNTRFRYEGRFTEGQSKNFNKHRLSRHSLTVETVWQAFDKWQFTAGVETRYSQAFAFNHGFHAAAGFKISHGNETSISYNNGYRYPTFNDLFWQPGGNPLLKPEQNREWNWRNTFDITHWNTIFYVNLFSKKTFDLIRWQPGNDGLWHPVNIDQVSGYGTEISSLTKFRLNSLAIRFKQMISYQKIINQNTQKQLTYTPPLIYNAKLSAELNRWTIAWYYRFQSIYYTDADNLSVMAPVYLNDLELHYRYKNIMTGLRIDNIFNVYYEWLPARPMPGRKINFMLQITLNNNQKNHKP